MLDNIRLFLIRNLGWIFGVRSDPEMSCGYDHGDFFYAMDGADPHECRRALDLMYPDLKNTVADW